MKANQTNVFSDTVILKIMYKEVVIEARPVSATYSIGFELNETVKSPEEWQFALSQHKFEMGLPRMT